MLKRLKGAAVGCVALAIASTALYAAGNYSTYPIVGGASFCASTVTGASTFGGNTSQGQATNGSICAQTVPAGPPTLTGTELVPMDTGLANGASPQTVVIPSTSLANGFGGTTIATTTGTTAAVVAADGISTYVYAGAGTATYTSFKLPPNPIQNQKFCLVNAGSGILTTTAIAVGTSGQSIVGGAAPTSIPVQVASGAQTTVTNASACYIYNVSNTSWYRVN